MVIQDDANKVRQLLPKDQKVIFEPVTLNKSLFFCQENVRSHLSRKGIKNTKPYLDSSVGAMTIAIASGNMT